MSRVLIRLFHQDGKENDMKNYRDALLFLATNKDNNVDLRVNDEGELVLFVNNDGYKSLYNLDTMSAEDWIDVFG